MIKMYSGAGISNFQIWFGSLFLMTTIWITKKRTIIRKARCLTPSGKLGPLSMISPVTLGHPFQIGGFNDRTCITASKLYALPIMISG